MKTFECGCAFGAAVKDMETPAVYLTASAASGLYQVHIKFILSPSERAGVFILRRYPQ